MNITVYLNSVSRSKGFLRNAFREKVFYYKISKAHIPNIYALNSDTHTLRIQYEYTQKQCVGVAIEGMDIWYMGLIVPG